MGCHPRGRAPAPGRPFHYIAGDRLPGPSPMIVGIAGYQNSGKTTLVELLIPRVRGAGFKVATVKHIAHNDLRIDVGGSDTARHRKAGAHLSVAVSDGETVFFHEAGRTLEDVLRRIEQLEAPDLVLVEGFKGSAYPKIVIGAVEHGGLARWRWDGTPESAASIAEDLMIEIRGKRAAARGGPPARAPRSGASRRRAGARSNLRTRARRGGRKARR